MQCCAFIRKILIGRRACLNEDVQTGHGPRKNGGNMRITRTASTPLVLHDPYFSIWSPCDRLYDGDTQHWCGERQQIRGYITVDETVYCFMGDREGHPVMEQVWVDISAVSTTYHFENGRASLTVCFTSPLLPDDPALLSRPCTYIDFWVDRKMDADVHIELWVSSDLVRRKKDELIGGSYRIRVLDMHIWEGLHPGRCATAATA